MKQIFTLLVCAGLFTACKTTTEKPISSESKMMTVSEAQDYAEFTEWKQQKAEAEMKAELAKESKPTVIYVRQPAPARTSTRTIVRQPSPEYSAIPPISGTTTQPAEKKKWSKAAKGAVIGAGAGAVAGAVIAKKNRVLGAVIGGVAGGGVGYGIGRGMDKRDGRY